MRRCTRFWMAAASMVLAVVLMMGCTGSESAKNLSETEEQGSIRVGFSMAEGKNPWSTEVLSNLSVSAGLNDMELVYHEPKETTAEWQKEDLMELLEEDLDYLVIFLRDAGFIGDVLEKAKKQEVPVILISKDSDIEGECAAVIVADYELEGRLCAQKLAQLYPEEPCNIVEILGPEDSLVAAERSAGFHKELENYPNLKVIAQAQGDFDRLTAEGVMEETISQLNPGESFQAVFGTSDEDGLGALQALKIAGYNPGKDVDIISINGIQDTLKAIVANEYTATIESSRFVGYIVVEVIARLERGYKQKSFVYIPNKLYDSTNAEEYFTRQYWEKGIAE